MKNKQKKGISLIVLIITIIVMIILATTIILSISSSNITDKANEARKNTDIAGAKELVSVYYMEWALDKNKIKADEGVTTFKEYAEKMLKEQGYDIGTESGQIEVTESGTIKEHN